jgi:hypothetical protein
VSLFFFQPTNEVLPALEVQAREQLARLVMARETASSCPERTPTSAASRNCLNTKKGCRRKPRSRRNSPSERKGLTTMPSGSRAFRCNASLGCNRVTACRKHFCNASCCQACLDCALSGAQTGTAGTDDDDVKRMFDESVCLCAC